MTLKTINAVATLLEEEAKRLTFLEKIRNRLYDDYYIKKRKGGKREINKYLYLSKKPLDIKPADDRLYEASKLLRQVHTKINNRIFKSLEFPESVHGFLPNKSILTAARQHVRKQWIISFDIKDFFPSVKSDYVYDSLVEHYGFGKEAAWLIARLVAYKGRLPQGAVTSPMASNVAFAPIDEKIEKLCKDRGITYTRYADDLTFSFDDESHKDFILAEIPKIVSAAGYRINEKKTKIYGPDDEKYVLGYVVTKKLNVNKTKRRNLEAAIYNFVIKHEIPVKYKDDPMKYKRVLMGKANYILNANPDLGRLAKRKELLRKFDPNQYTFTPAEKNGVI